MTTRHVYLLLALVGLVVPYYFFLSFLSAHGPDTRAFVQQLFATPIATFFAVDLVIASLVFVAFVRKETTHYAMRHWWLYVLALVTVGLSFALPLFLYAREGATRGR